MSASYDNDNPFILPFDLATTPIPVVYGIRMEILNMTDDMMMTWPSINMTNSTNTTEPAMICAPSEPYPLYRFICIVVAGLIAMGGIGFNMLLIALFSNRSCATTPPTLYPSALAVLDTLMCVCYVLIMFIDAIVLNLRIESLYSLFYAYVIPVYTLSKFVQLAIPYMLIFATLERLLWTSATRRSSTRENRFANICGALLLCGMARLPFMWSQELEHYPLCQDAFRTVTTNNSEFGNNEIWKFFDFQIMTFIQTIVPFCLLVILNAIIVHRLQNMSVACAKKSLQDHSTTLEFIQVAPFEHMYTARSTHRQVRSAILTMVAIVTSYLLCNSLQLILTILEKSQSPLLFEDDDGQTYSIFFTSFGDVISFLYMFTSAIRLFIYALCNSEIRRDLRAMLGKMPAAFPV